MSEMIPKLEYFLLCDDAEQHQDGRVDIRGFMMGPVLTDGPGHLSQLSCFLVFSGMTGIERYRPTVEIQPPGEALFTKRQDWQAHPPESDFQIYKVSVGNFPVREGRTIVTIAIAFDSGIEGRYANFVDIAFAPRPSG
jgi:hypothetical protein